MNEKQEPLFFFHASHIPFLHARGRIGTEALIGIIDIKKEDRVLDFGCGTGATLVTLVSRGLNCDLFGYDQSSYALKKARERLRFCGILDQVSLMSNLSDLELNTGTFDKIYIESVLATLPQEALIKVLQLVRRLLRLGGRLYCNETIWNLGISSTEKLYINQICNKYLGMSQCSEDFANPETTISVIENAGFNFRKSVDLRHYRAKKKLIGYVDYLSLGYSLAGKFRSFLDPNLQRYRSLIKKVQRHLSVGGKDYLTGYLFEFQKA